MHPVGGQLQSEGANMSARIRLQDQNGHEGFFTEESTAQDRKGLLSEWADREAKAHPKYADVLNYLKSAVNRSLHLSQGEKA